MKGKFKLYLGDCLDVLKTLPDNSIDSIVTDPPYGLSFMGRKWDYDVPSIEVWQECLRVLKPGGHLLAFAGTRTQHRMAVRIEDAGFEIRDMIAWVYGCLSEDSEVLTEYGWMPYNRAKQKNILVYDLQNDAYQWEKPSRWNEYRVESDTAYRIQSDHTDQIVSRGHRCIVERGGVFTFVPADELSGVERVPYLRGDFSALPEGCGELLLQAVLREGEGLAQESFSQRQGQEAAREGACWREKPGVEGWSDPLQAQGQVCRPSDQVRSLPCASDEHGAHGRVCDGAQTGCCARDRQAADAAGVCASHQPRRDGQQTGEPDAVCDQCGSQEVRARASYQTTLATITAIEYSGMIWCPTVSTGAFVARRNGKVFITGNSGFPKSLDVSKAIDKKANELPVFDAIRAHIREWRDRKGYDNKALNEAAGSSTSGCGMARHWTSEEGGQHAIPSKDQWRKLKALLGWPDCEFDAIYDVVKDGAERPVIGRGTSDALAFYAERAPVVGYAITAPATDAAREWQGWGTALKPALEPITVARKPLIGTVAENVLTHGTGALNIDGCRVPLSGASDAAEFANNHAVTERLPQSYEGQPLGLHDGGWKQRVGEAVVPPGRWPANLIHDGSGDVLAGFPNSTSNGGLKPSKAGMIYANGNGIPPTDYFNYGDTGSAARFFYCAKASKRDRDEGLEGFEVKRREDQSAWIRKCNVCGDTFCDPVTSSPHCGHNDFGWVEPSARRNVHPTVKPTDLMRYLCRLVTPPSGVVLDPFMGSGSTGKAAVAEGFRFIGIEREAEYVEIARARIGQPTEALAPIQQEIATMKADIQLQFNALDVRQTKLERASKATKETPKS